MFIAPIGLWYIQSRVKRIDEASKNKSDLHLSQPQQLIYSFPVSGCSCNFKFAFKKTICQLSVSISIGAVEVNAPFTKNEKVVF